MLSALFAGCCAPRSPRLLGRAAAFPFDTLKAGVAGCCQIQSTTPLYPGGCVQVRLATNSVRPLAMSRPAFPGRWPFVYPSPYGHDTNEWWTFRSHVSLQKGILFSGTEGTIFPNGFSSRWGDWESEVDAVSHVRKLSVSCLGFATCYLSSSWRFSWVWWGFEGENFCWVWMRMITLW